ncbi:MAG: TIGR00159 family protein, partial [Candidatus Omnitrophota bacterium]
MADYLPLSWNVWLGYLSHAADILITAVIIYYILSLLKGTRAIAIFKGIVILVFLTVFSKLLKLTTLSWLLSGAWVVGMVAIVIVFQPELRFLLAKLGSGKVAGFLFRIKPDWINAIIETMENAQKKGWGALIVIELNMGMKNYTETGIKIDGEVS